MAYNKTVWVNGTAPPINAENLNKIEQGIESAHAIVPSQSGTDGQVLTKTSTGAEWSDAGNPTDTQVAEAVTDWLDENVTTIPQTAPIVDASLTVQGAAADAKKTGDEISDLKSQITQLEAIPYSVKLAMDNLFAKVALYKDDPSGDYATFHAWVNTLTVLSISAVYTQGTVRIGDSLDALKPYLVVTANYDNGTSEVVGGYTLNGSLNLGTNTITVTYGEKTTTFEVIVGYRYSWKLSDGVLHVEPRGITGNDGDVPALWYLPNANLKTRRAIPATVQSDGQMPQFSNSDLTEKEPSGYYAIPIPADATSVTFGSTPTAYYMAYTFYNMQNGNIVRTTGGSFESDNPKTVTFSAGQYEYMSVLCKYGSAGSTITDANELTEFTLAFS